MHSAPIIVGGGVIGGESDQNQEEYPSPTSSEEATTTTTKDSNPTLTENISKSKKQEGLSKLNQEGLSKLNYTHLTKSTPNLPYSAPTHLHLDSTHCTFILYPIYLSYHSKFGWHLVGRKQEWVCICK